MVGLLIHLNEREQLVWSHDWNMPWICEKWRNIVSLYIMDFSQYKDSLMLSKTCVVVIGLSILQGFHIHYGMYVVARRLRILLLLFYFTRFPSTSRRLRGDNLKEKTSASKNKVSWLILSMKFWQSFQEKQRGSFGHAWGFQARGLCYMILFIYFIVEYY